ncbi:hypothetical protein [Bradyrhizobium sp. STM 3566]|uniref:hypothetical protein n=1 Tax=Bradyrhizobium sp. STM 3566 TaxID=578928 RepID=UPI00388F0091
MGDAKSKSRKLATLLASETRCIYCANKPTTVEHMPPIGMFKGRSRPNGMEFAACEDCNKGTSGADIVAAFYARLSQSDNPGMLDEAIGLRRKMTMVAPGVSEEFNGPSYRQWQRTPSGLFREMTATRVDGPLTKSDLTAFSAKLAMALYREHIGVPLPLDGGVRVAYFLNAGLSQKAGDGMLSKLPLPGTLRQGRFVVPDQFAYRYNYDGKSIIAGLAGFNSNLHILMIATSNPVFYDFPIAKGHLQLVRPGELRGLLPRTVTTSAATEQPAVHGPIIR